MNLKHENLDSLKLCFVTENDIDWMLHEVKQESSAWLIPFRANDSFSLFL